MSLPTPELILAHPTFVKTMIEEMHKHPVRLSMNLLAPRPRFRKMREVHAQRARKLRRRGEYVHFLRWEHGHCIYGWGAETPKTFTFRLRGADNP